MATRDPTAAVQLKFRVREGLRAQLEGAAKQHGLTLNAEITMRLEQSFGIDQVRAQDLLDRLLADEPAYRSYLTITALGAQRGGQRGAAAVGHPEWGPADWPKMSFVYACAFYGAQEAWGMSEPRERLPQTPTYEEYKARWKDFARAVAAGDEITIPSAPESASEKAS
jgi:hypothetical protein